ncbi:hypothetical protein ACFLRN_02830 [Thermoproteota archaeon]
MDDRSIPAIMLLLNFVFSIFGLFLTDFSLIFVFWSIVSQLFMAIVAMMAYENAKKIEFIEARFWKRFIELEENEKITRMNIEDLKQVLKEEKS